MAKLKPLLPTLRERKRYLAFQVLSEHPVAGAAVKEAVMQEAHAVLGDLDMAAAGAWFIDERWNQKTQCGILRVRDTHLDKLRTILTLVDRIQGEQVVLASLGASGMIGTAAKYLAG